ncbi:MAG: hypothetical protein HY318_05995 [Armatimonadetes bacterium]|nr:hypothetical protein [Armatimonadota bacterium]
MPVLQDRKAYCAQCGRELKFVPFANVKNIICKECYGPDRYRPSGGPALDERQTDWISREPEPAPEV